jgi:hypothetical protein
MAQLARSYPLSRRGWLLAGLGMSVSALGVQAAPSLVMRLDGDMLYVSAPDFHFLSGKPLERLKDGNEVTFIAQLSLSLDANRTILRPVRQRFVFSYDIWEERFSVTRIGSMARKGLTAAAAEAWCLESLAINTSGIPSDKPVWLRLDLRVADLKDQADLVGEGTGLSMRGLIDTLSRPARTLQPHWMVDEPPFRLGDLKRAGTRGSGSG